MATVLRVKRRHDHEPFDALIIAGKKRKTEAGQSAESAADTPLTAVVKFAGTLQNHGDDVLEHLNKTLSKDELKANYKQHVVDVANKARLKTQQESRENRYKVVNYMRSIDPAKAIDNNETKMTVIDVEHSLSRPTVNAAAVDAAAVNSAAVDAEKEVGYVYDVYYTQTEDDMHLDDDLSVFPFEQELVFDPYRENGAPEDDAESEDSNSESNWRNDYPDSDHSSNSIDDDDMKTAVRNLKLDGESSDLSTEEDFVYAADEGDVEAHGYDYAKYKARVKQELDEDEDSSHSDDDDYCASTEEGDEDGSEKSEN